MFTDMVGYTELGQRNESLSLELMQEQTRLVRSLLSGHNGKEVKTTGDGFLVSFPSALEAVKCAFEIQKAARALNASQHEDRRLRLRIGIHLGDVVESRADISGDAVNVASRIEPLAEEGGVCLTRQVFDHVQNKFELPLASLGMKTLKNVSAPLEVYKIVMPWDERGGVTTATLDRRRIVVLPFANMSPNPSDEYFADGMTEELISVLSKIGGLRVVARTSAMRFKGEKATASRIGQELKVGSLTEGSVRRSDTRVRITIQLVDTQSEEQLWGDTYDRELQDIFGVQTEIAQQVARVLAVKLGVVEGSAIQRRQTQSFGAHALYLKGRYHWNRRSEEEINMATKYFEEAIARDPEYALAYVGLADCYSILGYYGYRRPSLVYPKAKELAEKALTLDGDLAEAHASLGETLMQYYLDWERSGSELERALELSPSYATARMWHATHFAIFGRFEEALAEIRKAVELDPLSMIVLTDVGKDLYFARRYDEAIAKYQESLKVDQDFAIAHKGLAEVYAQKGLYDDAIREIETAIGLSKRSIFILDDLGHIYARAGMKEKAERVVEDLNKLSSEEYVPAYGRAAIYAGLGDKDKTMEWLQRAYEERSFVAYLKVDPIFDSMRGDRRFADLLSKMRLQPR